MSILNGDEQMSRFYCREDELRKLNKRYAGDKVPHYINKLDVKDSLDEALLARGY